MVRIVIIFLLMMGMAAPASAIETKTTGGFILSVRTAGSLRETSARRPNTKSLATTQH